MGPLGIPELLFILVIALLVFGPKRLPEIGRTMGRAMGEFRRATTDLKRSFNTEVSLEEERQSRRPTAVAEPPAQTVPADSADDDSEADDSESDDSESGD